MKNFIILPLLFCIGTSLFGQTIKGKVVDENTGQPLEYASIGIVNTQCGTITNEKGEFTFTAKEIKDTNTVRFSMIGYEAQSFNIKKLIDTENIIKLKQKSVEIAEVIVKPGGKPRIVGTTNRSMHRICGWEGDKRGQGHEIGTAMDLGAQSVRLESLHVRIHKQSFDSSIFRLHIRTIKNKLPDKELLNNDILLPVEGYKGWVKFDLSKYNIVLNGEVALCLEWLKVLKLNPKKLISVNGRPKSANVLFSMKKNTGCSYTKWGVEDKWRRGDDASPSFYLTVQE